MGLPAPEAPGPLVAPGELEPFGLDCWDWLGVLGRRLYGGWRSMLVIPILPDIQFLVAAYSYPQVFPTLTDRHSTSDLKRMHVIHLVRSINRINNPNRRENQIQ